MSVPFSKALELKEMPSTNTTKVEALNCEVIFNQKE